MTETNSNTFPNSEDFSRSPEKIVFDWLNEHNIPHSTVTHAPTHTVAQSSDLKSDIDGAHTKNLFLKDKKGRLILVSARAHAQLRLNKLHAQIGTARLSFAKPDLLWQHLQVTAGSVSAFALIHDAKKDVRFLLDKQLLNYDTLNFHPLRNDMTTSISLSDFVRFVETTGRSLESVDFSEI